MIQQTLLPDATQPLLAYWRAALADSALSHPAVPRDCPPIGIGPKDGGAWQVTAAPEGWIASMFSGGKAQRADDGAARKPIPLLLVPALLLPASSHGVRRGADAPDERLVPLCIPCLLAEDGTLRADLERLPWIPRRLLQPGSGAATIATLADLDDFLTMLTVKPANLADAMAMAAALLAQVSGARLSQLTPQPEPQSESDADATPLPLLELEDYRLVDGWFGLAYEPPVMARHIIRLYDLLASAPCPTPLLATLTHLPDRPARPPLNLDAAAASHRGVVGHINGQHALSPSQHEAIAALLDLEDGGVLAVTGPPGTGKTTLLQSVVAHEWVTAAIEGRPCPLIVAAATNVTAVENVLDSFARLGREQRHQRWLPDIGGFGLFLASASRESEHPVYNNPREHHFLAFETPDWVAGARAHYLERARASSLPAERTATVAQVTQALREQLRERHDLLRQLVTLRYRIFAATADDGSVGAVSGMQELIADCRRQIALARQEIAAAERIARECGGHDKEEQAHHLLALREIGDAELAWRTYLDASPWWLDLLVFLGFVRRRRDARDRAHFLAQPLGGELRHRDDGVEEHFASLLRQEKLRTRALRAETVAIAAAAGERRRLAQARKTRVAEELRAAEALLGEWLAALPPACAPWADVALRDLNGKLDLAIRAPMFQLADWYWSGCWLEEMEIRLRERGFDSKAPQKLEAMLRRFAKLTPCMVSNFHMAPAHFTGWMGMDRALPLWNVIDLLIVDEAGQVAPEIGAPTFALARRALVVGDERQIEPIWNIPEGIDRANAAKFGLTQAWDDPAYLRLARDGYSAAKGNLMRIGARAGALQKYPDQRGLMLTEQRRCVPPLVAYCNELVYAGRLQAMRAALPPARAILPSFGYLLVAGKDRPVGKSRKNDAEARAIVDWIARNRERLEQHYGDAGGQGRAIGRLLAVVTPFAPQANLIARLLARALPDTAKKGCAITVGTVHRLQGAEREIVLFSPVYGEAHAGAMFFDAGPNMLNVAVSRARDSFLVFGNVTLFDPKRTATPSGMLAKYLFADARNNLAGVAEQEAEARPAPALAASPVLATAPAPAVWRRA
ncbi:MAG TPA: hypothetical protein DCW29_16460 [Janthinobacterium sp.]|nr:hypothetical protein [Janthinobacterium sp.]